jgi:hypothetical protein
MNPQIRAAMWTWIFAGVPLAVAARIHFRYTSMPTLGALADLIVVFAVPVGIGCVIRLNRGDPSWFRALTILLYLGGTLFLSGFAGFWVAGTHGDAL